MTYDAEGKGVPCGFLFLPFLSLDSFLSSVPQHLGYYLIGGGLRAMQIQVNCPWLSIALEE